MLEVLDSQTTLLAVSGNVSRRFLQLRFPLPRGQNFPSGWSVGTRQPKDNPCSPQPMVRFADLGLGLLKRGASTRPTHLHPN
jgi:hypothetical protein